MRLFDGRSEFYQYDLNQKLICESIGVGEEVHFCNRFYSKAAVCVTYELDGFVVVDVPNDYLLISGELTAYGVCSEDDQTSTTEQHTFNVIERKRPSDYVYTETEVKSYEALEARIERLENGGFVGGGEGGTGKDGEDGVGIQSIERTDGNGSAGTTDTYTIVLTDGTSYTFTVYNGKDGKDGVGGGSGGVDGKDGITPHIGDNGNWFLGDIDTGVKARGEDGQDGITPHIGDNKNWFIGETDTGVRAEGKDGTGGSDGSSNVYSTEETVVGTWIDGKPIYRKCTITSSATFSSSSSDPTLKHNIENLGTVVRADTVLYDDGGVASQDYHRVFPNISNSDSWNGALLLTGTHYKFILGSNMKSSLQKVSGYIYIIVEYTKTTDTATIAIPSATALMAAYEEGVQNA